MVKKTLLWIYRAMLWLTGIAAISILSIALIIQLILLPNINQYKDKIEVFVSQIADQKIEIGQVEAGWQGINPHFLIHNIAIYDAQNRVALQLNNTDLTLSWLSIPKLEPQLASLRIYAPELTILRNNLGEIFIAGMSLNGKTKAGLPNWLLRQNKIEIHNAKVVWLDEMRHAPALSLDKINLQIVSPTWKRLVKNHYFTLHAIPSIGTNKPITITANIYGNDINQIKEWHGNIAVKLENTQIASFKPWFDYPIDVQSGMGNTEIISKFSHGQIHSILSKVSLESVKIQSRNTSMHFNHFSGQFQWESLGQRHFNRISQALDTSTTPLPLFPSDFSLKVSHLALDTNTGLNLQDAQISYTEKEQEQTLSIQLAHIDLTAVTPILPYLPLSDTLTQKISILAPQGALDNVTIHWTGQQAKTIDYRIHAKFSDFGIQAYEKIPGLSHLSGEIKADKNTGELQLQTHNAQLDFKGVLRWPIPMSQLNGEVFWKKNGQTTEINIKKLNLNNPHLSGTIDGTYLMNDPHGDSINLKAKFDQGDLKHALFYYPIALGKTTLHWLDTSILSGKAENIQLIIKGRLADFPFVDNKNKLDRKLGVFRVSAKISDSLLEYGTGWPMVEGLDLDLLFEGNRMELNAYGGHLYGNQIIKSKTTIAQLDAVDPILHITSELNSPVTEGIKFINNSPVLELMQGFTDNLKSGGQGKLNLSLKIPMNDLEAAEYKGVYKVSNGTINQENIPTLEQINGVLEFTESNLSAKNVKAHALGAPLTFDLSSGKDKIIRVTAKGQLTPQLMKQTLGKSAQHISGSALWTGNILIQKPNVQVDIQSDLLGITSRLPYPLNKNANERIALRVNKKQGLNTDSMDIYWGNKINTKIINTLENGKFQPDRIAISFNTSSSTPAPSMPELNQEKALFMYGYLDYLDADAWQTMLADLSDNTPQTSSFSNIKADLHIAQLDLFDKRINQLKISNKSAKEGTQISIQSREITGQLQWIDQNNGKLIARLSQFMIPESTPNRNKPVNMEKSIQNYPMLDIVADHFIYNGKNFDNLELQATPKNEDWMIQKLKLATQDSTISGDGQWNNWKKDSNTYLNLTWEIKDLGKMLNHLGYQDFVKDGNGTLAGQLRWKGSPKEFSISNLNGHLQLDMKKGQILKLQPGIGRLFGLLSLQSLPRRLSLDFKDLFSNGFSFDRINAHANIEHGILRSNNFSMSGPAADVSIKGETNLLKETQHFYVKVIPNISDSLSLAALAGGPLAGAVAFLAQKALKDPLNKVISSEYEIIGTWDNPQEVQNPSKNPDENKNFRLN